MKRLFTITALFLVLFTVPASAWTVTASKQADCVNGETVYTVTFNNPESEVATINQTSPTTDTFTVPANDSLVKTYDSPGTLTFKPTWPSDTGQPEQSLDFTDLPDCVPPPTTVTTAPTPTVLGTVVTAAPQPELAFTGDYTGWYVLAGVALVTGGIALRKRTTACS